MERVPMARSYTFKSTASALALAATLVAGSAYAQKTKLPDAQVQANVLRDMAKEPSLAQQQIQASTAFGVVTLTGNVTDDRARDLAERVASHSDGVTKVVDQLSVGTANASTSVPQDEQRAASIAPPPPGNEPQGPPPPQQNVDQQDSEQPQYSQSQPPAYPQTQGQPYSQAQGQPSYDEQQAPPPPQQGQRRRIYRRDYEQGMAQGNQYPQDGQYGPPQRYQGQRYQQGNPGGATVTIPAGTPVSVRLSRWLSSGRVAPGHVFEGFVSNDVMAGGQIALPRGTQVTGTVVDVTQPGALKGSGSITLQLQSAMLGGNQYPLQSEPWTINGHDKTGQTVGTTAVMGIFGALIGGAVGGGGGALAGAGIGAAGGLGISAASGGGNAVIPGEARVTFRLDQPSTVTTVSESEMSRMGSNVGPESGYARPGYPAPAYAAPYPAYGYGYPGYGYPYYGYPYSGVGVGVVVGRPYYGRYYYGRPYYRHR